MNNTVRARPLTQADIQAIVQALNTGQFAAAESQAKKWLKFHANAFVLWNLYGNALASQQKYR